MTDAMAHPDGTPTLKGTPPSGQDRVMRRVGAFLAGGLKARWSSRRRFPTHQTVEPCLIAKGSGNGTRRTTTHAI